MRHSTTLVLSVLAIGCSSDPELVPPTYAGASYLGTVLENYTADTPGKEAFDGVRITFENAEEEPEDATFGEWKGKAEVRLSFFAAQLDGAGMPIHDPEGEPLGEHVGWITFTGQWVDGDLPDDDGSEGESVDLDTTCSDVELTTTRTDVVAVCGMAGVPGSSDPSCFKDAGSASMRCTFSQLGTVVMALQ